MDDLEDLPTGMGPTPNGGGGASLVISLRPISLSPPSGPVARRTGRLIAMVHELHKAGYQRL